MNVEQFRQIIREEVSRAMQRELRDILTEAVEIASRPEQSRTVQPRKEVKVPVEESQSSEVKGLSSLLEQTAATMTPDEYKQVLGVESAVSQSDLVSENLESSPVDPLPDFVARAAKIFAAANEKDRERHGV